MKRNEKRALPVILLAIFLDLVCNGILVPIVPQLLADPTSTFYLLPAGIPISYSYIILGLLISAFPVFMFFSTPILGEYSDRVGRRKVMTLALAGTALSLGMFAVGVMMKSLTLLFIARILGGIMGGNLSVAQAAIADITPRNKRAARFGLIGAAYGFGFIIGPVIGGLLSSSNIVSWFNASTPFWFAAILSIINAILVFIFLEVKPIELNSDSIKTGLNWTKSLANITKAYGMKNIRMVFATNFLFQAGLALFATFFAVFLTSSFGFDQVSIGYYIGYAGIWVIISQGLLLRFLTKRYDEVTLLRVFLLLGAGSVFLYYITEHTIGLLIVGACFALTNGIVMAALPSLASRRAENKHQGEIMGINTSVQALAQAIPPILAGFLAAQITPSAPIFVAGAVIGAGWILFIFTVKKEKEIAS
ncbi:MAG: MFS transporter [Candidatus Paceibacterota bacterium]|jgi:DHA1 family tetracycline resistance protein-like MFS transporter